MRVDILRDIIADIEKSIEDIRRSLKLSDGAAQMIEEIDADGSGLIDFHEYSVIMTKISQALNPDYEAAQTEADTAERARLEIDERAAAARALARQARILTTARR